MPGNPSHGFEHQHGGSKVPGVGVQFTGQPLKYNRLVARDKSEQARAAAGQHDRYDYITMRIVVNVGQHELPPESRVRPRSGWVMGTTDECVLLPHPDGR